MSRIVLRNHSAADADALSQSFDGEAPVLTSSSTAETSPAAPREERHGITIVDVDAAESLVLFDAERETNVLATHPASLSAGETDAGPAAAESHSGPTAVERALSWLSPRARPALGALASVCALCLVSLSMWRNGEAPASNASVQDISPAARSELRTNADLITPPHVSPPIATAFDGTDTAVTRPDAGAATNVGVASQGSALSDPPPATQRTNVSVADRSVAAATTVRGSSPAPPARTNRSSLEARESPPTRATTTQGALEENQKPQPPEGLESSVERAALAPERPVPVDRDRPVPVVSPPAVPSTSASAERPVPAPPIAASTERMPPTPATVEEESLRQDVDGIQRALRQYQLAYERMDASAAQAVWPTVDVRALSRAFDGLLSQQISFHRCDLRVTGTNARASCHGSGTFVPKVGGRNPRTVEREWAFQLEKVNDVWMIGSTEIR